MKKDLTKRQAEVLREIKRFIRKEGMPPSVRDLGKRLDVTPSTMHKLLKMLSDKGQIVHKPSISRGIMLNEPAVTAVPVPLLGQIPAGNPVLSEEFCEGYVEVDSTFVPRGDLFALKVSGDSMTGANILDGDVAIIRKQEDAQPGDIVAALIEGEATLKRLKKRRGELILSPENDNYEPIELASKTDRVNILGKLVAVVRKY